MRQPSRVPKLADVAYGVCSSASVVRSVDWLPTRTVCFLFFFFQAEDGIRVLYVTGVQTCALPIFAAFSHAHPQIRLHVGAHLVFQADADLRMRVRERGKVARQELGDGARVGGHTKMRSEERRVGKEVRSGWWRDR